MGYVVYKTDALPKFVDTDEEYLSLLDTGWRSTVNEPEPEPEPEFLDTQKFKKVRKKDGM